MTNHNFVKQIFFLLCFTCFTTTCKNTNVEEKTTTTPTDTFSELMEKVVANNKDVPGLMLHVEAPRLEVSWNGAAGVSDVEAKTKLHKDQPFRIASVTKTFVATAILRLMEKGKLSLNDPISKYISEEHIKILKKGNYNPDQINIRHLLTHTSGLFDYALDGGAFVAKVKANPKHRWTRTEQLKGAMTWGKPYGKPGEKYHYSDTGYILLGEVLESLTSTPLAKALRTLVGYEKLGLKSTWLESLEDKPTQVSSGRIHQYLEDMDTYDWDPSCDLYGGGGLVSTTSDLAKFYKSLFANKVFSNSATLDTMLQKVILPEVKVKTEYDEQNKNVDYRCGIEVRKAFNTDIYMHTGFWGVQVAYIPEYDAVIAISFVKGSNYFFLKKIISTIGELDFGK